MLEPFWEVRRRLGLGPTVEPYIIMGRESVRGGKEKSSRCCDQVLSQRQ